MTDASGEFAELVERARQGDNTALAALVERYEPDVRIVARVLLGPALRPHLDSLDLVQSVHRSLLVGLREGKFDVSTPEKLIALTSEMVRRKVGGKWRKLRRQQRLSHGADGPEELTRLLASVCSAETNPAQAAQVNDTVEQVCRSLSEPDRRLLTLRLQGFSTAEAAREMDADADVLRVRLSRLRRHLRAGGLLADWL